MNRAILGCVLLLGCDQGDKRARCEKVFEMMSGITVQEAKDRGADPARLEQIRNAMPQQRASYLEGCMATSTEKLDCMERARTPAEAQACITKP